MYHRKRPCISVQRLFVDMNNSRDLHKAIIIFLVFFFEFLPLQQTDTNRFLLQLQCMPRFIVIAAGRIDEQTVFRTDKIIIVYALKILKSHGTGIACISHVQTELLFYNAHFMDFINRYSDAFVPIFYMDAYIDVIQAAFQTLKQRQKLLIDPVWIWEER